VEGVFKSSFFDERTEKAPFERNRRLFQAAERQTAGGLENCAAYPRQPSSAPRRRHAENGKGRECGLSI
jgi:hypothetical protein